MLKELTLNKFLELYLEGKIEFVVSINSHYLLDAWEIENRVIDEHIFFFNFAGAWVAEFPKQTVHDTYNTVFWLPPNREHKFYKALDSKLRGFINIRLKFLYQKKEVSIKDDFILIKDAEEFLPYFQLFFREYRQEDNLKAYCLKNLLGLLLVSIFRSLHSKKNSASFSFNQQTKCLNYIRENVHRKIDIKELSDLLSLTHDYFTRMFKKTFGLPPKVFIKNERLKRGQFYLLERDLKISTIARNLGYENEYLFHRQFKETYGVTPGEYRKNPQSLKMPNKTKE